MTSRYAAMKALRSAKMRGDTRGAHYAAERLKEATHAQLRAELSPQPKPSLLRRVIGRFHHAR
jgi:hypothetical protein